MRRSRFPKPVGAPPCELWKQWAESASRKCLNIPSLLDPYETDERVEQHMSVAKPELPLPPVLQRYPLPIIERPRGGLLEDSDDEADLKVEFKHQVKAAAPKSPPGHIGVPFAIKNDRESSSGDSDSSNKRRVRRDPPTRKLDPPTNASVHKGDSDGSHSDDVRRRRLVPVRNLGNSNRDKLT